MKTLSLIMFGLWLAAVGLAIYGFGVGAVLRGLSFKLNDWDSAIVSWTIILGMPLASLFLYLFAARDRKN